jgi:hypothetical protein
LPQVQKHVQYDHKHTIVSQAFKCAWKKEVREMHSDGIAGGFFLLSTSLPVFSKLFTMSIYYIFNLKSKIYLKKDREFMYNTLALLSLPELDTEIHSVLGLNIQFFKFPSESWAPVAHT